MREPAVARRRVGWQRPARAVPMSFSRDGLIFADLHSLFISSAFGPEKAQDEDEEHRHQEDGENSCRQHAADNAGADRVLAARTGAG